MSAKINETGHEKNAQNFKVLISRCTTFGASFNPVNPLITLTALNELSDKSFTAMDKVKINETKYNLAKDERQKAFDPLSGYISKINSASKAVGLEKVHIEDIKSITRKLQGKRATPTPTHEIPQ